VVVTFAWRSFCATSNGFAPAWIHQLAYRLPCVRRHSASCFYRREVPVPELPLRKARTMSHPRRSLDAGSGASALGGDAFGRFGRRNRTGLATRAQFQLGTGPAQVRLLSEETQLEKPGPLADPWEAFSRRAQS
jgi:hypothetical protein